MDKKMFMPDTHECGERRDVSWNDDDKKRDRVNGMIAEVQRLHGEVVDDLASAVVSQLEVREVDTPFGRAKAVQPTGKGINLCKACLHRARMNLTDLVSVLEDFEKLYDDSK